MVYDHLKKSKQVQPGYSDFFIGIQSDFTTLQKPTPPFTNPGDSVTIKTAHVPKTDRGALRCYQIKEKHTGKGDMVGTQGAKTFANEASVFVPGFDKVNVEFMANLVNEELITWHVDADCDNPQLVQLGDSCKPAKIDANYTIGTFEPTGEKGFFCTVKWVGTPKFYEATLPIAVAINS